jgi:hypothetical protein
LSWIEYELLQAEKYLSIAKATVILDVMPDKIKQMGIKSSESVRERGLTGSSHLKAEAAS